MDVGDELHQHTGRGKKKPETEKNPIEMKKVDR
jgi:hypothetical protein